MAGGSDFWEQAFEDLDAGKYDFSKSRPSPALGDFCDEYLREGAVVLDLGCGGGRNAHCLAERGFDVAGIDVAAAAVRFCEERFRRFGLAGTFRQGTFDRIPFADDSFDAVVCIAALDHVTLQGAQKCLHELKRVLKPGGVFLLTFDAPDQDEELLGDAEVLPDGTLHFVRGKQAGMLFRRHQDEELRQLVGEENLVALTHSASGARIIVGRFAMS